MARKIVGVVLLLAAVGAGIFAFAIHSAMGDNEAVIAHNLGRLNEAVPGAGVENIEQLGAFLGSEQAQALVATNPLLLEEVLDIGEVIVGEQGYIAEREPARNIAVGGAAVLLVVGLFLLLGGSKRAPATRAVRATA